MPRVRRFQTYDFTKSSYLNVKHNIIQRSAKAAKPSYIMKTEMPNFIGDNNFIGTLIGRGRDPDTLDTKSVKRLFRDAVPHLPDPVDPSVEHLNPSGLPIPKATKNTFTNTDLGLTVAEMDLKIDEIKNGSSKVANNISIPQKEAGSPNLAMVSNYNILPWVRSYQSIDLRELPDTFIEDTTNGTVKAESYYDVSDTVSTLNSLSTSVSNNDDVAVLIRFKHGEIKYGSNLSVLGYKVELLSVTYADEDNYFTLHYSGPTEYTSGVSDYKMYSTYVAGDLDSSNADESDGTGSFPYPTTIEMGELFDFKNRPNPTTISDIISDYFGNTLQTPILDLVDYCTVTLTPPITVTVADIEGSIQTSVETSMATYTNETVNSIVDLTILNVGDMIENIVSSDPTYDWVAIRTQIDSYLNPEVTALVTEILDTIQSVTIINLHTDFNTAITNLTTLQSKILSIGFNMVNHATLGDPYAWDIDPTIQGFMACSGTDFKNYVNFKKEQIDTLYTADYDTALDGVLNTPFGRYLNSLGGLDQLKPILDINTSNMKKLFYSFRVPIQEAENAYRDKDVPPDPNAFEDMLEALDLHDVIIPYGQAERSDSGLGQYIRIFGYAIDWEKLAKLPPLTFMTVMVAFSGLIEAQYPKPKRSWFSIIIAIVLTVLSFGTLASISIYLAYAAVASTIFYVIGTLTGNEKLLKIAKYIGYVMIVFSVSQGVQKISTMQGLQYAVKIASYVQNMKYEAAMNKLESEMAYLKKQENEMSEMMSEIERTEKVKKFIYGEHINVTHTETFNYDHLYTYF